MLFNLRTTLIALAIGFALGALPAWHFTAKYKDASWTASIEKQKVEAAKQLKDATDRALAAERLQNDLSTKLEILHVETNKKLNGVLSDNRKLSAELGGLRDPGRRSSCTNTVSSNSSAPSNPKDTTSDSRLSDEASNFLLEFARDADSAAEYAKTCHDWAEELGKLPK